MTRLSEDNERERRKHISNETKTYSKQKQKTQIKNVKCEFAREIIYKKVN